MNLPRYDDLLLPTLKAIDALGGSGTNEEIDEWISVDVPLSDTQLSAVYPKSGANIIVDRCSWARSYLKIANLVASAGRGVWVITPEGKAVLGDGDQAIRRYVNDAYNRRAKTHKLKKEEPEGNLPEEQLSWADGLLVVLRSLEPSQFERLTQRLLREAGFIKVEVTGKSGDGGVDGIGVLRLNLVSFQVFFQCKRYKGSVGSAEIRDFRGAMAGRADKGLIVTTGVFTTDAKREATRDGAPAIDLVDGEEFCLLLKQYSMGVKTEMVEEVTVNSDFFSSI